MCSACDSCLKMIQYVSQKVLVDTIFGIAYEDPSLRQQGRFFFFVFSGFIVVDYIHHMVRKLLSLLKDAFQFVIVLKIYSRLDDIPHQYWLYKRWDHYFVEPEWQLALVAELQLVPVLELAA